MIEQILLEESYPYPNNVLPAMLYPDAFKNIVEEHHAAEQVIERLARYQYTNAWVNGIFDYHHFHSNADEVLVCLAGEASVQLGGPSGKKVSFTQGDVLLLPPGMAHKRLKASKDFSIVGAYPNGQSFNTYKKSDVKSKELFGKIKEEISHVAIPPLDPVQGDKGAIHTYWK
ncbi:cupin domain-containing protein [Marinilactibacillus kalidii]|uniref:cupin domain-containing protein n=1 Tax=Marinilactibacillus kalidii TaxID=2820274 RepID=UPI001ABDC252|nr:cupin domain-containing protein [Marinilactibacillus kalidii]